MSQFLSERAAKLNGAPEQGLCMLHYTPTVFSIKQTIDPPGCFAQNCGKGVNYILHCLSVESCTNFPMILLGTDVDLISLDHLPFFFFFNLGVRKCTSCACQN